MTSVRRLHGLERRHLAGVIVAIAGPGLLSAIAPLTSLQGPQGPGGLFVLVVLAATLLGGLATGLLAAVTSFLGLSFFFIEPVHSFEVTRSGSVALAIFLVTAATVSVVVQRERDVRVDLDASRRLLASAIELGTMGAWALDPTSGDLWLSPEAQSILGFPPGEFDGRIETALAVVHPADVESTTATLRRLVEGEPSVALELRIVGPGGETRWIEVRGGRVSRPERDGVSVVGVVTDATDRIRRERTQTFVARAATVVATSLDYEETLRQIACLVVPGLADWCSIELLEGGEIRNVAVHHSDPKKVELARTLRERYPSAPDAPRGIPAVIRTGAPELYAEIGDDLLAASAQDEEHLAVMRELGLGSAIVVPLVVRGETIGALALLGEGGRRFDANDLALAEEIARRAAVAVDNARLHGAQAAALADAEEARARTGRLQAVMDALSETMTRVDVARVVVREGLVALRAQTCAVLVVTPGSGERVEVLDTSTPVGDADVARLERLAAEAIRTSELVVDAAGGERAAVVVPLLAGGEALGALHVTFGGPASLDDADRRFVQTVARQCALALERARLYEREQEQREQAERLALRLRRLQTVVDATFTGGASLDDLLEELLVRLRQAIGSDTATILIVNEEEDVLVVRKALGFDRPIQTRVPIGQGFAGKIAATQTHEVVPDISKIDVVSSYLRESRIMSLAGAPLVTEGRLVGVVHVGTHERREFDRQDLLLLRLVAARAAVAIDRARVHEREHRIAEVLQRSLLPERLPELEGLEIAARYIPGAIGMAVGGDWYDVFPFEDGSVGIVVGDVVGHGVRAAAAMGRLRNVLRAYALDGLSPAASLGRLNRLACEGDGEIFATVFYAVVSPMRGSMRFANAGHPPPLVRTPGGKIDVVESGRSVPIGADPETVFVEDERRVEPGSALILYTDGLVERRGESIDVGIDRLARVVAASIEPMDVLAEAIVRELQSPDHADDLAFVAVRLETVASRQFALSFPAEPVELAPMRGALRTWLESHGLSQDEIFEVVVAANEACSNAVEHPVGAVHPEIALEAELVDGELALVVRDSGSWREPAAATDGGRGLAFMRALMENVDIVHSGEGTRVMMRRRVRRG